MKLDDLKGLSQSELAEFSQMLKAAELGEAEREHIELARASLVGQYQARLGRLEARLAELQDQAGCFVRLTTALEEKRDQAKALLNLRTPDERAGQDLRAAERVVGHCDDALAALDTAGWQGALQSSLLWDVADSLSINLRALQSRQHVVELIEELEPEREKVSRKLEAEQKAA